MTTQEYSENGWPVLANAPAYTLPYITGRVASEDLRLIFNDLCEQFVKLVEPIYPQQSWGYAYRPISGSNKWSNHASGTAIDLNASLHPQGKLTFNLSQRIAIEGLVKKYDGVIRWGGDYTGTKDEMHFEIAPKVTTVQVTNLAKKLRGSNEIETTIETTGQVPLANVPLRPLSIGSQGEAVRRLQHWLNNNYPLYSRLVEDGYYGIKTHSVVMIWQRRSGLTQSGAWDEASIKKSGRNFQYAI